MYNINTAYVHLRYWLKNKNFKLISLSSFFVQVGQDDFLFSAVSDIIVFMNKRCAKEISSLDANVIFLTTHLLYILKFLHTSLLFLKLKKADFL